MDRTVITNEMIEDGMSDNGGWSNKQIKLLGQGMFTGWRRRAVGKEILTERYDEFLALKNVHLKNKRNFGKKSKNSTLLDKALTFIIDSFTNDGKFKCGFADACLTCDDCNGCHIKAEVCDILGIE